ncbi:MAG: histidine phosphatase family protein [Ilumatobacteraceae bacterium]|nr:histidine phosphatase family protein [Ilumatobacteraceae bacterium]
MVARFVSLLLLRHGQSEWNAIRRWQGLADSPLDDLGRRQAVDAAAALAATGDRFQSVWSSPLARAAETGEIIAAHLGLGDVRLDERLREADAGEWQGMTPDQIDAAYPGFLAEHRRPPTFESAEHVIERASEALLTIARRSSPDTGAVVVTTHSGVIRTIIRHLGWVDERVPNLGGVWISVDTSTTDATARFDLRRRFDPNGVVRTGVDAPGEDPGEQADESEAHRSAER